MQGSTQHATDKNDEINKEQVLQQLRERVTAATLAALAGSSDLPGGTSSKGEVEELLARYLAAEKGDVAAAAERLEQQAVWRRAFGRVTEVRWPRVRCIAGSRPERRPAAPSLPTS